MFNFTFNSKRYSGTALLNNRDNVSMYEIIGIDPFGGTCIEYKYVFVRISEIIEWIEDIVWSNEDKIPPTEITTTESPLFHFAKHKSIENITDSVGTEATNEITIEEETIETTTEPTMPLPITSMKPNLSNREDETFQIKFYLFILIILLLVCVCLLYFPMCKSKNSQSDQNTMYLERMKEV